MPNMPIPSAAGATGGDALNIFITLQPKKCYKVAAIWFEINLLLHFGSHLPCVVSTLVDTLVKPVWKLPSCALSVESNSPLQIYWVCSSF